MPTPTETSRKPNRRSIAFLALAALVVPAFPPAGAEDTLVREFSVEADGTPSELWLPHGFYAVETLGTYKYGTGTEHWADAAYSHHWMYGPCWRAEPLVGPLHLNGRSLYGTEGCEPETHTYEVPFLCLAPEGCLLRFHILDSHYGDNSGGLYVRIWAEDLSTASCEGVDGVAVAVCIRPFAEVAAAAVQPVELVQGPIHNASGYVNEYAFQAGPATTTVSCVEWFVDGSTLDPCARAGGVLVKRVLVLFETEIGEPGVSGLPPVTTARVCASEVTVSAYGFSTGATALTLC